MTEQIPEKKNTQRRWLRFGLRSLLILMIVLAVGFAFFTNVIHEANQEQEVVSRIQAEFPQVVIEYEFQGSLDPESFKRKFAHWLGEKTGSRPFYRVTVVWVPTCSQDVLGLVARFRSMRVLRIDDGSQIKSLGALAGHTSLESLEMHKADELENIDALASLKLKMLTLKKCKHLQSVEPLSRIKTLEVLSLGVSGRADLNELSGATKLKELWLNECEDLESLEVFASLASLEHLRIWNCPKVLDLSPLKSLSKLTELSLSGCKDLVDLSPLGSLSSLRYLSMTYCDSLVDLSHLESLPLLEGLNIHSCQGLLRLDVGKGYGSLIQLTINHCKSLRELEFGSSPPPIKDLAIQFCGFLGRVEIQQIETLLSVRTSNGGRFYDSDPNGLPSFIDLN